MLATWTRVPPELYVSEPTRNLNCDAEASTAQCAAVKILVVERMVPPQIKLPLSCKLAMKGYVVALLTVVPPTIGGGGRASPAGLGAAATRLTLIRAKAPRRETEFFIAATQERQEACLGWSGRYPGCERSGA